MNTKEAQLRALLDGLGLTHESIKEALAMDPSELREVGATLTQGSNVEVSLNEVFEIEMSWEPSYEPEVASQLESYCDTNDPNFKKSFVEISKIIVPSEFDKQQLLLVSKYFHDLRNIDTDLMAVNTIAHLYTQPELIEVQN